MYYVLLALVLDMRLFGAGYVRELEEQKHRRQESTVEQMLKVLSNDQAATDDAFAAIADHVKLVPLELSKSSVRTSELATGAARRNYCTPRSWVGSMTLASGPDAVVPLVLPARACSMSCFDGRPKTRSSNAVGQTRTSGRDDGARRRALEPAQVGPAQVAHQASRSSQSCHWRRETWVRRLLMQP